MQICGGHHPQRGLTFSGDSIAFHGIRESTLKSDRPRAFELISKTSAYCDFSRSLASPPCAILHILIQYGMVRLIYLFHWYRKCRPYCEHALPFLVWRFDILACDSCYLCDDRRRGASSSVRLLMNTNTRYLAVVSAVISAQDPHNTM